MRRMPVTVPKSPRADCAADFATSGKFRHEVLNMCGKLRHLDQAVAISIAAVQGVDERGLAPSPPPSMYLAMPMVST